MEERPRPRVFVSYAEQDRPKKDRFWEHLSGVSGLDKWAMDRVHGGEDRRALLNRELDKADIVVLLLSQTFLGSRWAPLDEERTQINARREKGALHVVPVLLTTPCDWKKHPDLEKLIVLPDDGEPIWSADGRCDETRLVQVIHKIARAAAASKTLRAESKLTGLASAPEPRAPDVDSLGSTLSRLVNGVADLLKKAPRVVRSLAQRLNIQDSRGDVTRTLATELVNARKAMDVAKALNHLDAELKKQDAERNDREVVRSLLWQILPFAIDFRRLILVGREILGGGLSALDLPLRSETVAEVVLAGIDDRCCRFAPIGSGMPIGAARVPLPAAVHAPLFIDEERLSKLVVQQLAADMGLTSAYSRDADLRAVVEGTLRYHAKEAPDDEILPYYLLFTEAPFNSGEPARAHEIDGERDLWALARSALGRDLPSLRLVRLTGGALDEETLLARHIEHICRRTP